MIMGRLWKSVSQRKFAAWSRPVDVPVPALRPHMAARNEETLIIAASVPCCVNVSC